MATLYEIKEYGYRRLNRQAPDKRAANIAALTYLEKIAAHSQTNISHWDVNELFGAGRGHDFIVDHTEINKRFFEHRAKMTENFDENEQKLRERIDVVAHRRFKNIVDQRKNNLISHIRNHEERILNYYREIRLLTEKIIADQTVILKLDGKEQDLATEITNIEKDGFFKLAKFTDELFIFNTQADIILSEKNPAANLNYSVNLGRLEVRIYLQNLKVAVVGFERNLKVIERYIHPHVSSSGDVCFGDIQSQANQHLHAGRFQEYMKLLAALLSSYSNTAPYVPLTLFKEASERAGEKPIIVIEDEMPF